MKVLSCDRLFVCFVVETVVDPLSALLMENLRKSPRSDQKVEHRTPTKAMDLTLFAN
jgi:hypothetical protein